jgi:hypothetical protein
MTLGVQQWLHKGQEIAWTYLGDGLCLFNATFNNISDISWLSVLLETDCPEKTTDLVQDTHKLNHKFD